MPASPSVSSISALPPAVQGSSPTDLERLKESIRLTGHLWAGALRDWNAIKDTPHRTRPIQHRAELYAEREATRAHLAYLDACVAFEVAVYQREQAQKGAPS